MSPVIALLAFLIVGCFFLLPSVSAHEGEDHSKDAKTAAPQPTASVSIVGAERNLNTDAGEFNIVLRRSPGDLRTGEKAQILVRFAEKVEGGFGGDEPAALEKALVTASVTTASGKTIAENLMPHEEGNGNYHIEYAFQSSGEYKIIFNVTTADKRSFAVDFPVSVISASVRSAFWFGLAFLSLLLLGAISVIFYTAKNNRFNFRKTSLFAAAALLIFAFGTIALAYFLPMRETRMIAEIPVSSTTAPIGNALETTTVLTVPKESQMLFGIKTELIANEKISGGLKTNGVVKARPDAKAVVVPSVAGRVILREGITLGAAIGRGETIGYVEQVLDVSAQRELESQRLEIEAQQREVEARRLDIKNSVLQLQAQQADQRTKANQAQTQMAQAQRELRRSENLAEVGAVSQKRVEEAQTAVKIAEQEIASARQQVSLLENQIKQAQTGQTIFRSPRINQPNKIFPLVAPVTGIINEIKAVSGQQVETATEILSLINLSTVLLEAQVFEKDLPTVRESTQASFTASALSGEIYTIGTPDGDGRIVSIGQTVNEQTRTFSVIYEVKNPLQRLRDGMFVEITIDTGGERETLAVPKKAVVIEQGESFVFVFNGGETFEKRPVALGTEGTLFYEIKSGLKEGERVVTEGVYQLRSTQPEA